MVAGLIKKRTHGFKKGDPKTIEAAKKGGLAASVSSPYSFKNNKEHAKKSGQIGGKACAEKHPPDWDRKPNEKW